jgi:hypothetical protein
MVMDKQEQTKFRIVIVLLFVAGLTAYFRFFHNRRPSVVVARTAPDATAAQTSELDFTLPARLPKLSEELGAFRPLERDIFARTPAREPDGPSKEETAPSRKVALELKAVMRIGGGAIARINDDLVRVGDRVGRYELVRINMDSVVLKSSRGYHVLTMNK